MPLNKATLQKEIYDILVSGFDQPENQDPKAHFLKMSKDLSGAIDDYVRSGDVVGVQTTVAPAIPVTAAGSNGGGPLVATGQTIAPGAGTQNNIGKIR